MGVHGLWQLISSTGKPVSLESLEGKVLAVDVSVWLHQLAKGMRDSAGNPLPYAHIHGLFTRICKLLHYRIKPVFVFDGGVPTLKKQTLAARRNKRDDAERTSSEMQQKILTNLIRSQALKEACGDTSPSKLSSLTKTRARSNRDAIYELPPMPESSKVYLSKGTESEDPYWARQELLELVEDEYDNINDVDVESADFKALPADIQFEIITDMREYRKNYKTSRLSDIPEDSIDFSKYQMAKLVKHNKLNIRLDNMRKEQNEKKVEAFCGPGYTSSSVHAQRITSEDSSHFILIQGLRKKQAKSRKDGKKQVDMSRDSSSGDSNQFDELLNDSDEELRHVDFLTAHHQKSIKSTDQSLSGPSTSRDYPYSGKVSNQDKVGHRQDKGTGQSKGQDGSKPVYRPVIEIESDSESSGDNSNGAGMVKMNREFLEEETDEMAADRDLQRAIELSLASQTSDHNKSTNSKTSGASFDSNHAPKSVLTAQKSVHDKSSDQKSLKSASTHSSNKVSASSVQNIKKQAGTIFKRRRSNRLSGDEPLVEETESVTKKPRQQNTFTAEVVDIDSVIKKSVKEKTTDKDTSIEKLKRSSKLFRKQRSNRSAEGDFEETVSDTKQSADTIVIDSVPVISGMDQAVDEDAIVINDQDSELDSEDDFIEVKIDADNIKEDSMFPADIFAAAADNGNTPKKSEALAPQESPTIEVEDSNEVSKPEDVEAQMDHESEQEVQGMVGSTDMDKEVEGIVGRDDDTAISVNEVTSESPSLPDVVGEKRDEFTNPKIPDLVRNYQTMETSVHGMRLSLAADMKQLEQERGRQERLATSINDQMNTEAQELLQLFGIPYIVSPTEAEAQCAQLDSANLTQGTITEDSDIWLFGGKCVFKNFFNQQKHVECFKSVHVQSQLGLTRQGLINIALLCGSDYTEGIQGVGPVTAMEILAEFPGDGIEGLEKLRSWWDESQTQIKVPRESKLHTKLRELHIGPGFPNTAVVDAYMSPTVEESTEKFTWGLPNLEMLRQFANQKLGWTQARTDELVVPVIKRLQEKEMQRRISSFFQPETYMQPAKMKSKRLQKVVNQFLNPEEHPKAVTEAGDHSKSEAITGSSKLPNSQKGRKPRKAKGRGKAVEKTEANEDGDMVSAKQGEMEDAVMGTKQSSVKKRNVGRGKGKGKCSTDEISKSKYFESKKTVNVKTKLDIMPEKSSSADSDSDSSSEFSSDSSLDSGPLSEDEMPVVENSLNIGELLQLKMGGDDTPQTNQSDISPKSSRVFESGLKVTEILNLDIGNKDIERIDKVVMESESEGDDFDDEASASDIEVDAEDIFKDEGGSIREEENDGNDVEASTGDTEVDVDNFKDEGGFIREEEESQDEVTITAESDSKTVQESKCTNVTDDSKKRLSIEFLEDDSELYTNKRKREHLDFPRFGNIDCKKSAKQARKEKNRASSAIDDQDDAKTIAEKCLKMKKEVEIAEQSNLVIKQECDVEQELDQKTDVRKVCVKQEEPVLYANNPIKQIVTGVPWLDKRKGKGRSGGSKGKGKGRNIAPVEKLEKAKPKQIRHTVGVANLSESDSDSS